MEHIGTKYEATIKGKDGSEYYKVPMMWNGIWINGHEMWVTLFDTYCSPHFFNLGNDEQYYKLGYYKVVQLDRIETYEERTTEIKQTEE